jgi:hypothetical protein
VVGAAEAARLLGISRQRFDVIAREAREGKRPGFPNATELACGPVWYRRHIRAWGESRRVVNDALNRGKS